MGFSWRASTRRGGGRPRRAAQPSIASASSVTASPRPDTSASAAARSASRNICGVRARHIRSRETVASTTATPFPGSVRARLRVSRTGDARSAPVGCPRPASMSAARSSGWRQGRAASCTSTQSAGAAPPAAASRASPFATDALRSAPPSASRTPHPGRRPRRRKVRSPGGRTTATERTRRSAASPSIACASIGRPASGANCFGVSAPKRRPAPAAATSPRTGQPAAARVIDARRSGRRSRPRGSCRGRAAPGTRWTRDRS